MKALIKKIIPRSILNLRHLFFSFVGAIKYKHPSEELFVIGITGTSGKSSTILLLRHFLEAAGYKVGALSTVDFYIAGEKQLNDQKMTMLGKAKIQEYLRKMVDHKCDIAIIEVTSEGAMQHRHKFINFDVAIMTNLYPEHIEHHGSFEKYKGWKLNIFKTIANCKPKYRLSKYKSISLCNKNKCAEPYEQVPKIAVANANNKHGIDFLQYNFDKRALYGLDDADWHVGQYSDTDENVMYYKGSKVTISESGIGLTVNRKAISTPLYGKHNAMNLLAAVSTMRMLGVDWKVIQDAAPSIPPMPGRIEKIPEADALGFTVIVDYAFEPVALENLYAVVTMLTPKRIIHVLGGTGGGRDADRRELNGAMAGKRADIVIVTDEDPYDEDPMQIMEMVASGAKKEGKIMNESLFIIPDRQEAITQAIALAQEGDIVLVTGKGSEQAMCLAHGKMIPWDDRDAVRKGLSQRA